MCFAKIQSHCVEKMTVVGINSPKARVILWETHVWTVKFTAMCVTGQRNIQRS